MLYVVGYGSEKLCVCGGLRLRGVAYMLVRNGVCSDYGCGE